MAPRRGLAYDWHAGRPPRPGALRGRARLARFHPRADRRRARSRRARRRLHYWLVVAGRGRLRGGLHRDGAQLDERTTGRCCPTRWSALQLALAVALTVGDQAHVGLPVLLLRGVHGDHRCPSRSGSSRCWRVPAFRSRATEIARRRRLGTLAGLRRQRRRGRAADDADARSAGAQPASSREARAELARDRRRGRARAVRAGPARSARPLAVGDRDQGRAGRAAAAGIARTRRRRGRRGGGGRPPSAQRGPPGGLRLSAADARRRARGRSGRVVGRRDRRLDRPGAGRRSIPRSRRCWPGPCARARRT